MKSPSIFRSIKKTKRTRDKNRRELIGASNQALNMSKRAIFALHRSDRKQSDKLLDEASALFKQSEKLFVRFPELAYEGAYKAALEEYAEALLFSNYLKNGKIESIDKRAMSEDIYIAGLCDTTGEIVRHALKSVTSGDTKSLKQAYDTVESVVEFLLELDLTGYLRTKFDQSKKNLRKLEEMSYDISIRK